MLKLKRAQSLNDYALVLAVVTLAGIGMQSYIKQGIQAVIKGTADVLTAGGTQPVAPAAAGSRQQLLLNLPDGAYNGNGMHNGINYSQYQYWHPAFINGYIKNLGGYVETKTKADGQKETTINPGTGMTGFISMVKEGNDVYYYHYPQQGSSNKIAIAAEDAATGILTTFSDLDGQADATYKADGTALETYTHIDGTGARIRDKTFSPYQIVRPSNDAAAQLEGIVEPGLYDYKQDPNKPLTVHTDRSITVTDTSLKTTSVGNRTEWNPVFINEYLERLYGGGVSYKSDPNGMYIDVGADGFMRVERKGNNIYYNHYLPGQKTPVVIGIEDAITRDYTTFDAAYGYPDATYIFTKEGDKIIQEKHQYIYETDETGARKTDETGAWTGKVVSEEIYRLNPDYERNSSDPSKKDRWTSVGSNSVNRTFKKYELVTINSQPVVSGDFTLSDPTTTNPKPNVPVKSLSPRDTTLRKTTINTDTTTVTGAWEATYKLENANTFSKSDKTTKPTATPSPPKGE